MGLAVAKGNGSLYISAARVWLVIRCFKAWGRTWFHIEPEMVFPRAEPMLYEARNRPVMTATSATC